MAVRDLCRKQPEKALYKGTNGAQYNDALRYRTDITIGFTQDAIDNWRPAKTGGRGRPMAYSDHALPSKFPWRNHSETKSTVARILRGRGRWSQNTR